MDDLIAGFLSPAMQALEGMVSEIAQTNIPILLVGESGTGKEVMARHIHHLSRRANDRFVKVACASLNPSTFSNAMAQDFSDGKDGSQHVTGTLFLDEVSELDHACQRYLMYAIPDEDSLPRNGTLGARVISSTNRNLGEEMRGGRFRSELYYRVNGVSLQLPPLRERREDIPQLFGFLLGKHAAHLGRQRPTVSPQTMEVLTGYDWPGNIRELENVARKVVALGNEHLAIAEMREAASAPRPAASADAPRSYSLKAAARAASREAERELIMKALARTRWNRKLAAENLQISYKSLLYKLKQIGLDENEPTKQGRRS